MNIHRISDLFKITSIAFILLYLVGCTPREDAHKSAPVPNAFSRIESYIPVDSSKGQTVYIPVYSHIPTKGKEILSLRAILSVRNTSEKEDLIVAKIEYFDTNGKLLKSFLDKPIRLAKMATYEVEISALDLSGGTGANFIVKWDSTSEISSPIIESLMYGASGQHSYSFISRGQVVERH